MRDHAVEPAACWKCRAVMDGALNPYGDDAPTEGDASFCLACGAPLIFTGTDAFREPTEDEYLELSQMPEWQQARRAVETVIAKGASRER